MGTTVSDFGSAAISIHYKSAIHVVQDCTAVCYMPWQRAKPHMIYPIYNHLLYIG